MKATRIKRRAAFVAATLLLFVALPHASPARSTVAAAGGTWTRVRTKNFTLVGDAPEREMLRAASRLEQFREVFTRLLAGDYFDSTVPTTVILFKDDDSYKPFKPVYEGKPADVAGHFQSGTDVDYISLSIDRERKENPYFVVLHEYVHLLVKNNFRDAPLWFNEGLAEYYSTLQTGDAGRRITLGKPVASHLPTLRKAELLPLQTLFAVDSHSPYYNEPGKRSLFYAESWALVHYLLSDAGRRARLSRYLERLTHGVPVREAFADAFQTDFASLETELKTYVRLARYAEQSVAFEEELKNGIGATQAENVSEAEALAYMGDLLLHTDRLEAAETYLQRALRLDPNLSTAHASLGMLRTEQRHFSEARYHLERAVASDPQNYLAHYYYAYALSREGMDAYLWVTDYAPASAVLMRAELKKAIELAPRFVEAYRLHAFVNLVRDEQLDEAVALLKEAQRIAPRRHELSLLLAQIYIRREEFASARELLQVLAQSSPLSSNVRAQAQTFLASLPDREAFAARRRAENNPGDAETPPAGLFQPCDMSPTGAQHKRLRFEGQQRCGKLVSVECVDAGVLLLVELDAGATLKLHSDALNRIRFVTYTTEVRTGQLDCGLRQPASPVLVTFRSHTDARTHTDGEVLAVEFIPRDWYANN